MLIIHRKVLICINSLPISGFGVGGCSVVELAGLNVLEVFVIDPSVGVGFIGVVVATVFVTLAVSSLLKHVTPASSACTQS